MTRAALLVLAVAAALAVTAATAAGKDPRAPKQRYTVADTRLAKSLALRRADLAGGWTPAPAPVEAPPCTASPDETALVQTARIDPSFVWSDRVTTVGSEIDIFRSAREALVDWRLSTLALMRTCLLESARSGLGKGVAVSLASGKALPPPAGTERSLHYRLVFAVRTKQRTLTLVSDVIAVGRGRITVVLHTLTVAQPLPSRILSALTQTLIRRLNGGRTGV